MSTAAVASFSSPPLFPCSTFRHPGPAAIRRTSIPSDEKASVNYRKVRGLFGGFILAPSVEETFMSQKYTPIRCTTDTAGPEKDEPSQEKTLDIKSQKTRDLRTSVV
jgi:hypothetical protein